VAPELLFVMFGMKHQWLTFDSKEPGQTRSGQTLIRALLSAVGILIMLAHVAPSGAASIEPTFCANSPKRSSYKYVQFFGQRWHLVVGYQGSEKIFDYNPDWTVKVIRQRAIFAFRLSQCQDSLSLFNLSGVELPDKASTDAAGINPGDHLVLGPRKANPGSTIGCRESLMWRAAPLSEPALAPSSYLLIAAR
jgi:hypothetical protein